VSIDNHGDSRDSFVSRIDAVILADIVAHPYQLPSLRELRFINQRLDPPILQAHLDSLIRRELVERVSARTPNPRPTHPDRFYGLTELGRLVFVRRMPRGNARLLQEAYAKVDKPPEIRAAERAPRPPRDR
jgi:hypothetical protein